MKKAAFSIGLVTAIVLLTAVSCGSSTSTTTETAGETADAAAVTETAVSDHLDALPDDLDYNGAEIHFAVWNRDDIVSALYAETETGEVVNDAVYDRNRTVEERLNVKLVMDTIGDTNANWNDAYALVEKSILAGDDLYDIGCFCTANNVAGSLNHELRNLRDIPNLNLDAKYWAQNFNNAAYIGDAQYVCAGFSCLSLFRYAFVCVYNKTLGTNYGYDTPVDAVNDGTWTIDYLHNMTKDVYQDLNGNGEADDEDLYGFISGNRTTIDTFWTNTQCVLFDRDEDGYFYYNPTIQRYSDAVDKILSLYYDGVGSYILEKSQDTFREPPLANMFAAGQAMTAVLPIYSIETYLRDMKDEFVVLPMPKFDEAQDGYYTFVQDQVASYFIPVTVPDSDLSMVGAALECLESESYEPIFDAYYESALSYKYVQNEESVKMLRIISDSVTIDASGVYGDAIGNVIGEMRGVIQSGDNTVASTFASVQESLTSAAASFKETMMNYNAEG